MKNRPSAIRRPQSAFTLVELLVVIGIIAVLASLILVGGSAAMRRARIAAIHTEIGQLDAAFTEYTNDRSGGDYPPNVITDLMVSSSGLTAQGNAEKADVLNTFKRHFNKAFPKHREPQELLVAIAGVASGSNPNLAGGMSPHEAVVFWLGGFSDDPKYPISGPGGPSFDTDISRNPTGEDFGSRTPIFDFDQARLGPRADDNTFGGRVIQYTGPNGDIRQINFWQYFPKNRELPYAYFDASRKPKFEAVFASLMPAGQVVVPIKQGKLNATTATIANVRLANEDRCQILSAGIDDNWGPFVDLFGVDWTQPANTYNGLTYPEGPFTGELADTITNFSTGATLEDSQP